MDLGNNNTSRNAIDMVKHDSSGQYVDPNSETRKEYKYGRDHLERLTLVNDLSHKSTGDRKKTSATTPTKSYNNLQLLADVTALDMQSKQEVKQHQPQIFLGTMLANPQVDDGNKKQQDVPSYISDSPATATFTWPPATHESFIIPGSSAYYTNQTTTFNNTTTSSGSQQQEQQKRPSSIQLTSSPPIPRNATPELKSPLDDVVKGGDKEGNGKRNRFFSHSSAVSGGVGNDANNEEEEEEEEEAIERDRLKIALNDLEDSFFENNADGKNKDKQSQSSTASLPPPPSYPSNPQQVFNTNSTAQQPINMQITAATQHGATYMSAPTAGAESGGSAAKYVKIEAATTSVSGAGEGDQVIGMRSTSQLPSYSASNNNSAAIMQHYRQQQHGTNFINYHQNEQQQQQNNFDPSQQLHDLSNNSTAQPKENGGNRSRRTSVTSPTDNQLRIVEEQLRIVKEYNSKQAELPQMSNEELSAANVIVGLGGNRSVTSNSDEQMQYQQVQYEQAQLPHISPPLHLAATSTTLLQQQSHNNQQFQQQQAQQVFIQTNNAGFEQQQQQHTDSSNPDATSNGAVPVIKYQRGTQQYTYQSHVETHRNLSILAVAAANYDQLASTNTKNQQQDATSNNQQFDIADLAATQQPADLSTTNSQHQDWLTQQQPPQPTQGPPSGGSNEGLQLMTNHDPFISSTPSSNNSNVDSSVGADPGFPNHYGSRSDSVVVNNVQLNAAAVNKQHSSSGKAVGSSGQQVTWQDNNNSTMFNCNHQFDPSDRLLADAFDVANPSNILPNNLMGGTPSGGGAFFQGTNSRPLRQRHHSEGAHLYRNSNPMLGGHSPSATTSRLQRRQDENLMSASMRMQRQSVESQYKQQAPQLSQTNNQEHNFIGFNSSSSKQQQNIGSGYDVTNILDTNQPLFLGDTASSVDQQQQLASSSGHNQNSDVGNQLINPQNLDHHHQLNNNAVGQGGSGAVVMTSHANATTITAPVAPKKVENWAEPKPIERSNKGRRRRHSADCRLLLKQNNLHMNNYHLYHGGLGSLMPGLGSGNAGGNSQGGTNSIGGIGGAARNFKKLTFRTTNSSAASSGEGNHRVKSIPPPLVIPQSVNNMTPGGSSYTSILHHIRRPSGESNCSSTLEKIPPYTPPPMLSPIRPGSGLYCKTPGTPAPKFMRQVSGSESLASIPPILEVDESPDGSKTATTPAAAAAGGGGGNSRHSSINADCDLTMDYESEGEDFIRSSLPKINLGPRFQACIPNLVTSPDWSKYTHPAELLWKNNKNLNEKQLSNYLDLSCSAVMKHGGTNKELAINILHKSDGDIRTAVVKLITNPTNGHTNYHYTGSGKPWTKQESTIFDHNMKNSNKDFGACSKELKTRSTAECVERYYHVCKRLHQKDNWEKKMRQIRSCRKLQEEYQQQQQHGGGGDYQQMEQMKRDHDQMEHQAQHQLHNLVGGGATTTNLNQYDNRYENPAAAAATQQQVHYEQTSNTSLPPSHLPPSSHEIQLQQNHHQQQQLHQQNAFFSSATPNQFLPATNNNHQPHLQQQKPPPPQYVMPAHIAHIKDRIASSPQGVGSPIGSPASVASSLDDPTQQATLFTCPTCHKGFSKVKSRNAHMKTHGKQATEKRRAKQEEEAKKARDEAAAFHHQQLQNHRHQQQQYQLPIHQHHFSPNPTTIQYATNQQQQQMLNVDVVTHYVNNDNRS